MKGQVNRAEVQQTKAGQSHCAIPLRYPVPLLPVPGELHWQTIMTKNIGMSKKNRQDWYSPVKEMFQRCSAQRRFNGR
jgi:hypothetical protein